MWRNVRACCHETEGTRLMTLTVRRGCPTERNEDKRNSCLPGSITQISYSGGRTSFNECRLPVVAWSKAWFCGCSLAGISGSNPAGGTVVRLLSVVFRHVEISALGWSLVQRSPNECGASECNHEASTMKRPLPTGGCCTMGGKKYMLKYTSNLKCIRHIIMFVWLRIVLNGRLNTAVNVGLTLLYTVKILFCSLGTLSLLRWVIGNKQVRKGVQNITILVHLFYCTLFLFLLFLILSAQSNLTYKVSCLRVG
jgi:hypothetical protein